MATKPRAATVGAMDARTVDEVARELRELQHEERFGLILGPSVLVLAVLATRIWPSLAIPLFAGGLYLAARVVRVEFRRYCLLEDLSGVRDAYAIPEIAKRARVIAAMPNRRAMAASIRSLVDFPGRQCACADELEELAAELERDDLDLDPVLAVACQHLVSDASTSSLLDVGDHSAEISWQVRHIRTGFAMRIGGC